MNRTHDSSPQDAGLDSLDPVLGMTLIAEQAVTEIRARAHGLDVASRELVDLLTSTAQLDQQRLPRVAPESLSTQLDYLAERAERDLTLCASQGWMRAGGPPISAEALGGAIERGVRVRIVVDEAVSQALGEPGRWLPPTVPWRVVGSVPVSLLLVDGERAVLADSVDEEIVSASHPGLVAALAALADVIWQRGAETSISGGGGGAATAGLSDPVTADIVARLAAGHTDEAAARATGMSVRQVGRLVAAVREDFGCETRFQMGCEAARRGWV